MVFIYGWNTVPTSRKKIFPMLLFCLLLLSLSPLYSRGGGEFSGGEASEKNTEGEKWQRAREDLVLETIEARGVLDPRVLQAMRSVARHLFVPESIRHLAYTDQALPIGYGQTISQPYIVALMSELIDVKPGDRVLEIGTGSGYQAAVLAEITDKVFTVEIVEPLARAARQRLQSLGYRNVQVRNGDGYYGWEENAPFDAIIVTAAAGHLPPPLLEQLKPGGKIVIPIGAVYQVQQLTLVLKDTSGEIWTEQILPVRFVPFTGTAQEISPK